MNPQSSERNQEHQTKPLWLKTPLIYSNHLSEILKSSVYLKLENLQPSHSFKYRGISHFIQQKRQELGPNVHFVISSGGNAGLAAACAARHCGQSKCTVFIPEGVSESTLALLRREGAEVVIKGKVYSEATEAAAELVKTDKNAVMVHAYNDPILWEGHGSMIQEAETQLRDAGVTLKPDAVFCSVGGGGLLGGIMEGCKKVGWEDVPLVAIETIGSDCFYHSMSMNNGRFNAAGQVLPPGVEKAYDPVHDVYMAKFSRFQSRASGSLGASLPAEGVLRTALEWKGGVKTLTVPDETAMDALVRFLDNQKLLVELSCSTALVPGYHPTLFDKLVPPREDRSRERVVIFIVCGGFKTSLDDAQEYRRLLDEQPETENWTVKLDDGQPCTLPR